MEVFVVSHRATGDGGERSDSEAVDLVRGLSGLARSSNQKNQENHTNEMSQNNQMNQLPRHAPRHVGLQDELPPEFRLPRVTYNRSHHERGDDEDTEAATHIRV